MIEIILMVNIIYTQNMFQDNIIDIFAKKHWANENDQYINKKQAEVGWN